MGNDQAMEAGAFFLLVVAMIVIAVLAVLVYSVFAWLRRQRLHPEADKVEGASAERHDQPGAEQGRPAHRRVRNEQRRGFAAGR